MVEEPVVHRLLGQAMLQAALVPEPASVALLVAGLLMLGVLVARLRVSAA